LKPLVWI